MPEAEPGGGSLAERAELTAEPAGPSHPARRRRRANAGAEQPRSVVQRVKLTPDELERLRARAAEAGVTVPRLLVEAAFTDGSAVAADYRKIGLELVAAQSTVGRAADNMNQVARKANTVHEVPSSFRPAIAELRDAVEQMSSVLDLLIRAVEPRSSARSSGVGTAGDVADDAAHEPDAPPGPSGWRGGVVPR